MWQLLMQYTKQHDVVVQYGGDSGIFATVGRLMGRLVTICERNKEFCDKLPDILHKQGERLIQMQEREKNKQQQSTAEMPIPSQFLEAQAE